MAPRARSRPEQLGRTLSRTLRRIEGSYPDQAHRIWEIWEDVVAEPLRSHCRPLEFRNGTLVLAVSSASWMQQVQFLGGTVRDTLNKALEEELIARVRLRVAEAPPPPPPDLPPPLPPTEQLPPLPSREQRQLDGELEGIIDPQLRKAVRRARERAQRLELLKGDPTT